MKVLKLVAVLLCLAVLNGCAVGMALHGKAEPQIDDLQLGMPIERVHFIMRNYTPAISFVGNKRIEEYDVQIGNAPSAGRALGHLAMDVFTWGIWEIVGTPMEAVITKSMKLTIIYERCLVPGSADKKPRESWIVSDIKTGKEKGEF